MSARSDDRPDADAVVTYLRTLQDRITTALAKLEGGDRFRRDVWQRPEGGGGESRVLSKGRIFEQAGINFSDVHGQALPPSATARRPQLAGQPFRAMGLSLVIHPANPYVPTSHANVRFFSTDAADPDWWFGGGG